MALPAVSMGSFLYEAMSGAPGKKPDEGFLSWIQVSGMLQHEPIYIYIRKSHEATSDILHFVLLQQKNSALVHEQQVFLSVQYNQQVFFVNAGKQTMDHLIGLTARVRTGETLVSFDRCLLNVVSTVWCPYCLVSGVPTVWCLYYLVSPAIVGAARSIIGG